MVKIIFAIIAAGALYYVVTPLMGRKVSWVDAEDPLDERIRELQLKKKINLKALKDIEFELASGKINEEDYQELKDHYLQRVSKIMTRIEALSGEIESTEDTRETGIDGSGSGPDGKPVEEEAFELHHGGRGKSNQAAEEDLEDDEVWTPGHEEEFDDEDDEGELYDDLEGDDEDWEEEDDDDDHPKRDLKGPVLAVLAFFLAMGTGAALFQMGKRAAVRAPAAPSASLPSASGEQAGLEHLVQYVQENPWNVTSHLILGEYYLGEGNTDLALSHFISAETVAPDDSRVLSSLGKTYRQLGNPDQAIVKFKAAVDAEPDSLEHLYQLGLVYGYDKDDRKQALALFEEILSRQPDEELRTIVDEELKKMTAGAG